MFIILPGQSGYFIAIGQVFGELICCHGVTSCQPSSLVLEDQPAGLGPRLWRLHGRHLSGMRTS